ncbi:arylamine N-acetyltransferase family protein [Streptomyces ochraceiscleroticus]|uniref:Arylamine N-acetyltransferase n=1 Tax=Streptomyces ochraceiscleroticus TaxID=47761 RepID=A0ABW1MLB5_9ACTN|nr:arylamine N-acetyltransferase [Streptomyces ochraceiscleroticus]
MDTGTEPDAYVGPLLRRIGHPRPPRPGAPALHSLYRAWITSVPHENFDVFLGHQVSLQPDDLMEKFGHRHRGGMCFELNAAFCLLLRGVGFDVTPVDAVIMPNDGAEPPWGTHVALLIQADGETWFADVGVCAPFAAPLPLCEGVHVRGGFSYRLERRGASVWRAHYHSRGPFAFFDFCTAPVHLEDYAAFANRRAGEGPAPHEHPLVHIHRGGHELALRARTFRRVTPHGKTQHTVTGQDEYVRLLKEQFAVPVMVFGAEAVRSLWDLALAQHQRWTAGSRPT